MNSIKDYDCIIIGAGFSGLAAGIRLAHFGKKVCICEQHNRLGGLNSWYRRGGFEIDSGLHAMTNFVSKGAHKSFPLKKLLRQLRIPYEALGLCEQKKSAVIFPDVELEFSNDFNLLRESIFSNFPNDIDEFLKFDKFISEYDGLDVNADFISTASIMSERLKNPLLRDMLLCPVSFYGSAWENDMDFAQFTIMYKSIFHEGFCVPSGGIRSMLKLLKDRFYESGGELVDLSISRSFPDKALLLNAKVGKILHSDKNVFGIELVGGGILRGKTVISSAGLLETLNLATDFVKFDVREGNLAFTETVAFLEDGVLENDYTIIFFSNSNKFEYSNPNDYFSTNAGVICTPSNYEFPQKFLFDSQIRVTLLADYRKWSILEREKYCKMKEATAIGSLGVVADLLHCECLNPIYTDVFTPMTIERFTGHCKGAIYGSPTKVKTGCTNFKNLYICGTDQGFLGITGAMLSGISMANMYALG